jgi:hypothetical protein
MLTELGKIYQTFQAVSWRRFLKASEKTAGGKK